MTTSTETQIAEKLSSFSVDSKPAGFERVDPKVTSIEEMCNIIDRDGGLIVKDFINKELANQIKSDLKPYFDTDRVDSSGFFPETTQRATGLLGISDGCVDLALHPIYTAISRHYLTSTHTAWTGQKQYTAVSHPQISSTVGFRVNPGGRQQALHRDDGDYHAKPQDWPVMIGSVTALTKTTARNGATVAIPGSHKWDLSRCPYDEEAVPAELEIGDTFIFLGNVVHAGGRNITTDESRETVGIFLCKGMARQAENQYLMVPPELAKKRKLSPAALRILGYGISLPSLGFKDYQDPMISVFGIDDAETVHM